MLFHMAVDQLKIGRRIEMVKEIKIVILIGVKLEGGVELG